MAASDNIEMESMDSSFGDFGINSVETISDSELDSMIYGDAQPDDVTPIKKETDKIKQQPKLEEDKEPKEDLEKEIRDQLLGDEDSEEDETKSKITPKTKELEDKDKEESDNTFTNLSKELLELGIFSNSEDEEDELPDSPEGFKDRFLKEVSNQANAQVYNFLASKHGEEGIEIFNSIFVKGISPKDYLSKYSEIESLSNLDITREDNQEKVYRSYYKGLGWADEKIDSRINKLKDYGDLEEEATIIHEKLLEQESQSLKDLEVKKQNEENNRIQRKDAEEQSYINILAAKLKDKEFDGIPVTEGIAKQVKDELVKDRYQLPNGERLTEFDKVILDLKRPENYETKVKLWLLLRSGMDLSKVKTNALSKKSDTLFSSLAVKEKTAKRATSLPVNQSFGSGL